MKKFNLKKSIVLLTLFALIGGLVFTSLAYFTDKEEVTNTFTVGMIDIELDEPLFKNLGDEAKRLVPGKHIDKDPTVTVVAKSEDAYVFMYLENNIEAWLENLNIGTDWMQVATDNAGRYLYVYSEAGVEKVVPYSINATGLPALFDEIVVKGTLDNDAFANFDHTADNIKIGAYAHQAEANEVDIYAAALVAAKSHFGF